MTQQVSIELQVTMNCLTDSFVFTPGHCINFKAVRYDSTSFNKSIGDKLYDVTLVEHDIISLKILLYSC